MIPFGMARFVFADADGSACTKEYRVLDLSALGFTFRLKGECPCSEHALLSLYSFSKQAYTDVLLSRFTVSAEETTPFFTVYRLELEKKSGEIAAFQEEYARFTRLKQAGEEDEITRVFCRDTAENRPERTEGFWVSADAGFALALETRAARRVFLDSEWGAFLSYFKERFTDAELFDKAAGRIGCLYIGNEYCVSLLPGEDEMRCLLSKARELGMLPVIVLPPLGESVLESTLETVRRVCIPDAVNGECAVVANDIGTAARLGEMPPPGMRLILGTLMNKRKADTRMGFMRAAPEKENMLNMPAAGRYLKALGVSALSYETDGLCPVTPEGFPAEAHAPFFRMNTALVCPLRRAFEGAISDGMCPGFCGEHAFAYAPETGCLNRFNSLFGIARGEELSWASRVILHI